MTLDGARLLVIYAIYCTGTYLIGVCCQPLVNKNIYNDILMSKEKPGTANIMYTMCNHYLQFNDTV